MHSHTPTLNVIDPRGMSARRVGYHRKSISQQAEPRITRQLHDAAARPVAAWDARLFQKHQNNPDTRPNQTCVCSLGAVPVLTDNVDAGWGVVLMGLAGEKLAAWDGRKNQQRTDYDCLLRPLRVHEQPFGETTRTTERFVYAGASEALALRNQCGQLIRHDDTAGSLLAECFSISAEVLSQTRFFLSPVALPDWPTSEADLESAGATTAWHYNALSELTHQTDAEGNCQRTEYSVAGQLQKAELLQKDRTEALILVSDLCYTASGKVTRSIAGNGLINHSAFDPTNGLLQRSYAQKTGSPHPQDLRYTYDPAGNTLSVEDLSQPVRYFRNQRIDPINRYVYDTLYQLIKVSGTESTNPGMGPELPDLQIPGEPAAVANYEETYEYDGGGNLTMQVHVGARSFTRRTSISAHNNRSLPEKASGELPSEAEIAASYDAGGNLLALQPGQPLVWDMRNQLQKTAQVIRENADNDSEVYVYNGVGQRVRKVRTQLSGVGVHTWETRYLPGLEIRTSSATGERLHVIVAGGVRVLHWQTGLPSGMSNDQMRFSLCDQHGSTTLELDRHARLISRESYYPYGGTALWAARTAIEADYKTVRYSGQERDHSGLYYYGLRYYAPWLQRWINPDPAGTADGLNLFSMVHGNPIGHVDVQGLVDVPIASVDRGQRLEAAQAAGIRDLIGASAGVFARNMALEALNQIPPSETNNALLSIIAGVLDGVAIGYVAGGVAGNLSSNLAIPAAVTGLVAGLMIRFQEPDTREVPIPRNDAAIGRIAGAVGALTRELAQQTVMGHGANYAWGSVPPSRRWARTGFAALAYVIPSALRDAIVPYAPASVASFISPIVEGIDGATGTYIRAGHPDTTHTEPGSPMQAPGAMDTVHGSAGRQVNGALVFWMNQAIEMALSPATGWGRTAVNALRGALSAITDFRGLVMQIVSNGWAYRGPRLANVNDAQSNPSAMPSPTLSRRHSAARTSISSISTIGRQTSNGSGSIRTSRL